MDSILPVLWFEFPRNGGIFSDLTTLVKYLLIGVTSELARLLEQKWYNKVTFVIFIQKSRQKDG